jgi:tRNA-specific 2-thiouridylase
VATGHYARLRREILNPKSEIRNKSQIPNPKPYKLLKGKDPKKDQSYVLYRMDQESLAETLFPLGEMTKEEVRKKAKQLGLPVHDKEESQEICFVEDDNYVQFLKEQCPEVVKPGPIVDELGKVVGEHEGIAFYTLGQRKGIGSHRGKPKYVIKIDRQNNTIVVGDQEDTLGSELVADQITYVSGEAPTEPLNITAKIRYNAPEAEAVLYPEARVVFARPQRSITPGQSVVFYKGDEILGGGIIS